LPHDAASRTLPARCPITQMRSTEPYSLSSRPKWRDRPLFSGACRDLRWQAHRYQPRSAKIRRGQWLR
jgi:hypothetical protein